MRVGDFGVEIVPADNGRVREVESGHVLARPGQVYRLRLRNFGPLHCVADVEIDGERVTAGGLVLAPWSTTELEGPIDGDSGCFTVVAEGDESVFGEDGGRDNPKLGLIEARFRRELPRGDRRSELPLPVISPARPAPDTPRPTPSIPSRPPRFPVSPPPPEWVPLNRGPVRAIMDASAFYPGARPLPPTFDESTDDAIEGAAGTGLTGHSTQEFVPISLGPLETEATVIRLRLVIGSEEAIRDETVRPLAADVPSRPAPRP